MSTNSIFMKGRLFGYSYRAVDLWEFRRELTLTKRLIKIAEKYVAEKETRSADSFEGVCFYISRSIITYSKSAFDNLVLGHFDTTEMIIRAMVENRVILDLIFNDTKYSLWKYYLVYSHHKHFAQSDNSVTDHNRFAKLCTDLEIDSEFLERRGNKKPYIEMPYIHTISGDGELMLTILASFAQEESRSVSDNCKWRIRSQFASGQPTGQTIYGFDVKNGVYTIKPQEAEVVRSIYGMYLSGMGRLKIMRALNEKGIPSPDGGEWVPSVVSDILRNEKYVGDLMLQKYYVNNHIEKKTVPNRGELPQYFVQDDHEGIVDRDTFLMVQIEMARRKEKYGRKRIRTVVTTEGLTGKIFCGQCGKGYNRKITRAGTPYEKPVWICRTFNLKGKAFCASR